MAMADAQIRFEDGAAYERMMGAWSRLAGDVFLDWLKPAPGLRWIDIGCGSGAFSELLVERCAPLAVEAVDPSEAQLAFARTRPASRLARFQRGDAMSLPFTARDFDAAVMALVIFFVPEPAKGVAEMVRVVKPGGLVSAYAWDVVGGGLPFAPFIEELQAMGRKPPLPPSFAASRLDVLQQLWRDAGIDDLETRQITVSRTFADFDDYWDTTTLGASLRQIIASMAAEEAGQLKARLRARLATDSRGRIIYSAHANAIKGRLPT